MRVTGIFGRPRINGNCFVSAMRFLDRAESLGATAESFFLNRLGFRDCQACYLGKGKVEHFAIGEDLREVFESVREADVVLMASPVYYGDIFAQAKAFIERAFSCLPPDCSTNQQSSRLPVGKTLVLILSQGHLDERMFADRLSKYEKIFSRYSFEETIVLRADEKNQVGTIHSRKDILDLSEEVAKKLFAPSRAEEAP